MSERRGANAPWDDPVRGRLLEARAPGAILERWRAASDGLLGSTRLLEAEVVQTYYVPGKTGRLFVHARIGRRAGHRRRRYLYLQVYRTQEQALRRAAGAARGKRPLRSTGPPVFAIPEWNAVVWELPNGPRLRGLRTFMQRKALRRFLGRSALEHLAEPKLFRPKLIRYVPRKRAVFRWRQGPGGDGAPIFVKLFAPGADTAAMRNIELLASDPEALGSLVVPELVHHDEARRAILMSGLPGRRFTELSDRPDDCDRVARSLADLHASGFAPERAWTPGVELQSLERASLDLSRALPGIARPLTSLRASLARELDDVSSFEPRPIHANLFGDQILIDQDNVGMVDWDDLVRGDPVFDLARLLAHVHYTLAFERPEDGERAAAALRSGYERATGVAVPERRLRFHLACALVLRGKIDGLRKVPEGWADRVAWTVDEAARQLGSGPRR